MNEHTFRAVVASVLIGALALAVVITLAVLPRSPEPSARPTASRGVPTTAPTVTATPVAGPVFDAPEIVGVGPVSRGSSSALTLRFEFVETDADAIPDGPGSFRISIVDQEGDPTVAFVGTPSLSAPGSLGATVSLVGPNVLGVDIVASDTLNVEPITISGLGISATSTAAAGPVAVELSGFSGSLAGGLGAGVLPSPGSVIALS